MNALKLPPQSDEQLEKLEEFYRRTKDVRLKTRSQMILLAAKQNLKAPQIGEIVRESDNTVRRWIKRYSAEGIEGLYDAPRPGAEPKVTADYVEKLVSTVRQRPRSLELPLLNVDVAAISRLFGRRDRSARERRNCAVAPEET